MTRYCLATVMLLLAAILPVQAQIEPLADAEIDPDAHISWPPPVYAVRGQFEVIGTANLPQMTSHFLEYRPLADDLSVPDEDDPWLPATLPGIAPVIDDVLGVWDTTAEADGLYELRLVITVSGGLPVIFRVSPLRVDNTTAAPPATPTPQPTRELPTPAPLPTLAPTLAASPLPTLLPTPTAFDPTPRVTPNRSVSVNVRTGDGTGYPIIGSLDVGEFARVIGRSSTGTGWYYVELNSGQRGWVAGDVVTLSGSTFGLPLVAPPATPTPIATPTPALPDAALIGIRYDRGEIRQGEQFQIIVRARNNSTITMPDTQILCTLRPVNREVSANVGALAPFEERDIFMPPLTLDSGGGGNITVDCAIDVNRLIPELNEENNYFSITTPLRAP